VSRVRWRRVDVALALAFLVTLPAVNTRIHVADEIENFAYLRSLWFDRDLSFDNEYRYFYEHGATRDEGFRVTFIDAVTDTGLRPNYAPMGSAILWAPFYAVADAGVRLARAFGSSTPADGYSRPYLTAITIGSAVYGALAVALSIAVARRVVARPAYGAGLVALVGTPLIFYMYAQPGMSHATSAFAVALFIWTWLRVRDRWTVGGVALLAAEAGLMGMVREQDAFLVIVPAADYLWTRVATRQVSVADVAVRLAISAFVFTLAFLPQLLVYQTLYDRFGPSKVIAGKMFWYAPWAFGVVLSPAHGWFVWTPLAAIAVGGLLVGAVTRPARTEAPEVRLIAAFLLLAVVIEIYVVGSLRSWTLAGAFGQRRFVGLTVCLTVGLALLWSRLTRPAPRRVVAVTAVLAIWWNLGLALRFGENTMNRQRLELGRDLYATFVELPQRLPVLAWRYVFDRRSFYGSRTP
jgi:hypothetical protein